MPYVERNAQGKIKGVFARPQKKNQEFLDKNDVEIQEFKNKPETHIKKRNKSISEGGYGTVREQLKMIHKQGIDEWKAHRDTVESNHPKT